MRKAGAAWPLHPSVIQRPFTDSDLLAPPVLLAAAITPRPSNGMAAFSLAVYPWISSPTNHSSDINIIEAYPSDAWPYRVSSRSGCFRVSTV